MSFFRQCPSFIGPNAEEDGPQNPPTNAERVCRFGGPKAGLPTDDRRPCRASARPEAGAAPASSVRPIRKRFVFVRSPLSFIGIQNPPTAQPRRTGRRTLGASEARADERAQDDRRTCRAFGASEAAGPDGPEDRPEPSSRQNWSNWSPKKTRAREA